MNLPPRKDAVRQFWVAIRAGARVEVAVAGLGNNRKTGPRYSRKAGALWFRQAGGASRAAPARADQTEGEPEPSTDLSRAPSAVPRRPGDVGFARDDLPVDLRSDSGGSAPRAGHPSAHRQSLTQAAAPGRPA